MKAANAFFDINLLLYRLSEEPAKSEKAEDLIAHGGVISVQVLNEFVSVATRKLAMTIAEVRDVRRCSGCLPRQAGRPRNA
jgi:predicted nucleic acid-binding protein